MSHRIETVRTGGQHGADLGGWRAAKALGIPTAGLMPLGFRTEGTRRPNGVLGPDEEHPEYADLYGATQHHSRDYPPRTRINVESADLTLIFNVGPRWSSGTKSAAHAAGWAKRPFVVVGLQTHSSAREGYEVCQLERLHQNTVRAWDVVSEDHTTDLLCDFLDRHAIRTLNVAGNRESSHPGVGAWVEAFLLRLLAPDEAPNEIGPDSIPPEPAPIA